jgi:transposase-like protein
MTLISKKSFAKPFKYKAVKQVVERGYTVADITKRLQCLHKVFINDGEHQNHLITKKTKVE